MSGRDGGGRREGSGWKFQGIVISNMVVDSWWCTFHFCFACDGWCKGGVLFKKKVVYVQQRYGGEYGERAADSGRGGKG